MKCPRCEIENPEGMSFCRKCGAPLLVVCPSCGNVVTKDDLFCGKCGHGVREGPPGEKQVPELEGERKHVTILFSDISGYTALSEKLDPEELKEVTGPLFGRMTKVIEKYGGFVEKYIGDAVMAVFGAPSAHEDDPVRAIRAAREINTGLVVTGAIDGQKGTHGIAGDPVNVASRLCSLAHPGEIVAGQETWKQAEGYFDFEELPPATVKGKTESLRVFKVLSPKEKPLTVHRLRGVRARLTGRDAEMDELKDAAERLFKGEGTIIALSGDAGTGKSRLIEEFKKTLQTPWFEAHAYPYAQNTPYSLVTALMSRVLDIEEGDAPETVREKLERHIRALTGDGASIIPCVGSLYSLPYPTLNEITPEHWKFLLRQAFTETLSALSQRPTVIVFDDLQWADPSSLELLRSFLMDVRLPSLFLFAYRPEFSLFTGDQAASLGTSCREMRLHDLSSSESLQMLRSLLDTDETPRELQRFFQERIQGNPFYLEEVINGLIDSGTLVRVGNTWKLTKGLDDAEISSGVHGIIEARLDRLEKEAKRVLQEASVIGRSFLYEILKRITALAEQCERCVSGLERLDFVRTKTLAPDLEYMFKHALTQEVVYNGLLKKDRREIHERIARVMEGLFSQRLPEFYEILAYHYSRGESSSKAIEYLMKSGEKSLARYSVSEAYQSYEQAYGLISVKTQRTKEDSAILIDILINWAFAFYYLGHFGKLIEVFQLHEKEAASLRDEASTAMFSAWLGWAYFWTGKLKLAREYLVKAKDTAEKAGDQRALGYAYTFLSYTASFMGMFEEALDAGRRALEIGKAFPSDHYLSFKGLSGMAFTHLWMGDLRSALADSEALLDYGRKESDYRSLVLGYIFKSGSHFYKGDMAAAIECGERARDAARDALYGVLPKDWLGIAYLMTGRIADAERELADTISFHERYNVGWLAGPAYVYLAMGKITKGQVSDGLSAIEVLGDDFFENGNVIWHMIAEQLLGTIYLRIVEGSAPMSLIKLVKNLPFLITNVPFADGKAQKYMEKTIKISKEIGAKLYVGQAYLNLGLLHRAKKRKEKAKECLTEAVQLLAECDADGPLRQAQEALESLGMVTGVARRP
jgi:class 3 adenylate cyclase/tetratricopeptide (TPR) repeat protein